MAIERWRVYVLSNSGTSAYRAWRPSTSKHFKQAASFLASYQFGGQSSWGIFLLACPKTVVMAKWSAVQWPGQTYNMGPILRGIALPVTIATWLLRLNVRLIALYLFALTALASPLQQRQTWTGDFSYELWTDGCRPIIFIFCRETLAPGNMVS